MPNLVVGTKFSASFPTFTGSFRNAKFDGNVEVKGEVLRESYGADKGQHTFTFRIDESSDESKFKVGAEKRMKGRNMYPNIKSAEDPEDYEDRATDKAKRASTQSAKVKSAARELSSSSGTWSSLI